MNHQPNNPSSDLTVINDRVAAAVHSHRTKIRALTMAAFVFGFLAMAASIGLAFSYASFILPKQIALMNGSQEIVQQLGNPTGQPATGQDAVKRIENWVRQEALLSRVVGTGTSMLALAVGVLGLSTMLLLLVVILNRRVALNQVNTSLAEISNQLREMHNARAAGGVEKSRGMNALATGGAE